MLPPTICVHLLLASAAALVARNACAAPTDEAWPGHENSAAPEDGRATEAHAPVESEPTLNDLFNQPFYGVQLTIQNQTRLLSGSLLPEPLVQNVLAFQPLIPVPLAGTGLFLQPYVPFVHSPIAAPAPGDAYATGLADTALLAVWVPFVNWPVLWGIGPTAIFPTATRAELGQGHWQVGPALAAFVFPDPWVVGFIAQHWWSVGGEPPPVSQMTVQYFLRYALPNAWQIGMAPDVYVDYGAPPGERVTFPVGLGVSKALFVFGVPFRALVEVDYSIVRPELVGREWTWKVELTPLLTTQRTVRD